MGNTCSYILVQPGDGCASLASRCGISGADFTTYNPSPTLCSTLVPGQPVCCSAGSLPNLAPQPNPDGTCATHTVVAGDTCWDIANKNYITTDNIEQWNLQTWGWTGCDNLQLGPICISTGDPPMPPTNENAQCGPTVPGTARPSSWSQISSLNPCPLNACCDKWGMCGITPDFCTPSQSSTGAPGTSAPGTNGCISNCGTSIVNNGSPGGSLRIGYFEVFGVDRACLTMEAADLPKEGYTHVHYAFGSITEDFQVDLSAYIEQFEIFAASTGFKRIFSSSAAPGLRSVNSYPIFREGVTDANRLTFAQSVVDTVKKYNLDGVDFDWEYPGAPDIPGIPPGSPSDGQNYLAFLKTVRSLLPAGVSLSIAAPASYWYLRGFPIAEMAQVLDYIVYMTYDLHGQWDYNNTWSDPGCPSPLGNCLRSHVNLTETELALAMITKAGVPASKIAVGIASYGRSFGMAELDALTSGASSSRLARRGVTTWYDSSSDSDMMTYGDGTWVAYMSPATKASRINRYASYGFAGTVEWAVDLAQFVLGQNETHNVVSATEQVSRFKAALALSNADSSLLGTNPNFTDLATRIYGFDGCDAVQQKIIYSGWQQSWKIIDLVSKEAQNGIDINSGAAIEYLGAPAFSKDYKAKFEYIFQSLRKTVPASWFNPFPWYLPVRCDDPKNACPDPCKAGPMPSRTLAYTWLSDSKYQGRPSINFCPKYFTSQTLDEAMNNADTKKDVDIYADLRNYYPSQGGVWTHELMHVDWATGVDKDASLKHIVDLWLKILEPDPDNPGGFKYRFREAYGPANTKSMARFFGSSYYTIKHADSLTLYALARYVQKALGDIYPHLPLAGDPPDDIGGAFVVPGYFTMEPNGTAVMDPSDDGAAAGDDPGACSTYDVGDSTPSDDDTVTLSANFAAKSDYPADYLSSYSSWAGLEPTTTAAAPAPTKTWVWGIAIYSEPNCTGDYYSLEGHNVDSYTDQCLQLRGSLPMSSDTGPSCRWFTGGGTVCRGISIYGGACTAYDTLDCELNGHAQGYYPDPWDAGCHNYDESQFDTKTWVAVKCGAQNDWPNTDLKVAPVERVVAEVPPAVNGSSPSAAAAPSRRGTPTTTVTVSRKVNVAQGAPTSLVKVTTTKTRKTAPSMTGDHH
ncbi:glycoside hydrolase family 18 protein [Thermothielavioides terrestris NRRL 8126]|uniref:chitinase n=2 Tax=Thermothielavioides terrestris TaxID=2587410 RepID=G2R223_THETT|nr:glycoside hydrolase family 18 protein [Thermothielavioides terrestris NRRL 8126]AEO66607.1 glycoside hydrolase family 18 protein [Thermothielavioides terrestris NRRL 8126]